MKRLGIKKNVCGTDRIIRAYGGLALLGLYWTKTVKGTTGIVFLIVGADLLASSIIQFCTINKIFGINSCKGKSINAV